MSTYRLSQPYERTPLQRRASGLALALALNLGLLLLLLTLGTSAPEVKKVSRALVVDLLPESHSASAPTETTASQKPITHAEPKRTPPVKPPPIVLPAKPTIAAPPVPQSQSWVEMSKDEMAATDLSNLPKAGAGSGSAGDSEVVGKGPHGETLYAAEWARHPTHAELSGYLPSNAPDGFGLIACRTVPGDRVEDCVELDQEPHGSHLASAVRQAAWQFRIRPPRRNGVPLVGSWVSIRIDYERVDRPSHGF